MNVDHLLQLQQPLKEGGIRSVNFFNGRLLTSKDLTREQVARRESDSRVGLGIGDGVAFGLEAARDPQRDTPAAPVLRIKAGLAINRLGQTLRLTGDISVALTRKFAASAGSGDCDCVFAKCDPIADGVYVAGAGVYVLTIAPSSAAEGRAPTNGLDPLNVRCNTDANVEALQFRLLSLTQTMLAGLDLGSDSLRNELAYRCFGSGIQSSWFESLLTAPPRVDDLLEALRKTGLGEQEVPLALLYFRGASQLVFVDVWAVRRPLHRPETGALAALVESRPLAAGHAMFMQFQSQIAQLGAPVVLPGSVTARSHFRYLPPVGVIPVPEESNAIDAEATRFFAGLIYRGPAFINGARLEGLVRESLCCPPIDTQSGEFVWLYRVRENREAIDLKSTTPLPRSYLVFASGHLPYRADSHFDTAHWNYSNYALAR